MEIYACWICKEDCERPGEHVCDKCVCTKCGEHAAHKDGLCVFCDGEED